MISSCYTHKIVPKRQHVQSSSRSTGASFFSEAIAGDVQQIHDHFDVATRSLEK